MEEQGRRTVITFLVDNGLISNRTIMTMLKRMIYTKIRGCNSKRDNLIPVVSFIGVLGIFYIMFIRNNNNGDDSSDEEINSVTGVYDSRNVNKNGVVSVNTRNTAPASFSIR